MDETGAPIPDAPVFVASHDQAFDGSGSAVTINHNRLGSLKGRFLRTDDDGAYAVFFAEAHRGIIVTEFAPELSNQREDGSAIGEDSRIVDTPADNIDLVRRLLPTAVIRVRVIDAETGAPLRDFAVSIAGKHGLRPGPDGEVAHKVVLVNNLVVVQCPVYLEKPPVASEMREKTVALSPGQEQVVTFIWSPTAPTQGVVVDSRAVPIEGALVFFGEPLKHRGLFSFPEAPSAQEACSTDREGRFNLRGAADVLSVFHPEYNCVTVPVERAGRIVLARRGSARVTLANDRGEPAVAADVRVDGHLAGHSTETGVYEFPALETGVHGLYLQGHIHQLFEVRADETTRVASVALTEPTLLRLAPDLAAQVSRLRESEAFVTRREAPFLIRAVRFEGNAVGEVSGLPPGRYIVHFEQGRTGILALAGNEATVSAGGTEVSIEAASGARVLLVPRDIPEIYVSVLARHEPIRIPAVGTCRVSGLPDLEWGIAILPDLRLHGVAPGEGGQLTYRFRQGED